MNESPSVLTAACPSCTTAHRVAASHAGRRVKCKTCGAPVPVPALIEATAVHAEHQPKAPAAANPVPAMTRKVGSVRERMAARRQPFRVTPVHIVMVLAVVATAIGYLAFNK